MKSNFYEKKYDEENQVLDDHHDLFKVTAGFKPSLSTKKVNFISSMTKDEDIDNMTVDDAKRSIVQFSKDNCHSIHINFFEKKNIFEIRQGIKEIRDRLLTSHNHRIANSEHVDKPKMEPIHRRQSFRDKSKSVEKKKKSPRITIPDRKKNKFVLFVLNLYSAFVVFVKYLFTVQSAVSCMIAIAATLYTYFYTKDEQHWLGKQDWALLGFAVITPMSASVGMTFNRREAALRYIATFRSTSYQIYFAHASWDWKSLHKPSGRTETPLNYLEHADSVLSELISMGDELCQFLLLPTMSRARHRVTSSGKDEASRTAEVANRLFNDIYVQRMSKLTLLTEQLKVQGLANTEAARIRAWERIVVENVEHLRMIKTYRSPQGLRCFARLFSAFLPPLYAPTFAQLARDMNSLSVAIVFTVITSLALTGLFESITVLEDPFVAKLTLDGIDVHEELNVLHYHELTKSRSIFFPNAGPYNWRKYHHDFFDSSMDISRHSSYGIHLDDEEV